MNLAGLVDTGDVAPFVQLLVGDASMQLDELVVLAEESAAEGSSHPRATMVIHRSSRPCPPGMSRTWTGSMKIQLR